MGSRRRSVLLKTKQLVSSRAIVRGRVQGVFFRAFVRSYATDLNLTGYVRNLPGGRRVEIYAEGDQEQLAKLIKHLERGPSGARIDEVEVKWGEYTGIFPKFEVRY